jgi:hypothetical protein
MATEDLDQDPGYDSISKTTNDLFNSNVLHENVSQRLPRTIADTERHNLFVSIAQDAEYSRHGSSMDNAVATCMCEHERKHNDGCDPKTPSNTYPRTWRKLATRFRCDK